MEHVELDRRRGGPANAMADRGAGVDALQEGLEARRALSGGA